MIGQLKAASVLGAGLLLAGCAISDVGEIAARKTALNTGQGAAANGVLGQQIMTARTLRPEAGAACALTHGDGRTAAVAPQDRLRTDDTNLIGLGHLTPSKTATSRIEKNDMVSIRLRSVYLSDAGYAPENVFSDIGLSAAALGETSRYVFDGFDHNLEVLIAVNAFDYGATGSGFRFDQQGRENAKVIFYSEDVTENQFLSFDNLPIIGPLEYSGAGLGLQLYALEIDAESDQQKALLSSLATVGVAAAGLTGPGAGVLNELTTALLDNGNTDDRIFEYAVGFDTGFSGSNLDYVPLEENLYAFVADHARQRNVPWERIALNSATAELMECVDNVWEHLRDHSYMIVQVIKGFDGQPPSQIVMQSVGDLTDSLRDERTTEVTNAIDQYSLRLKKKAVLSDARRHLGALREGAARIPAGLPVATASGQLQQSTKFADPPRAQLAAFRLAQLLIRNKPTADGPDEGDPPQLAEADYDYILSELYKITVRAKDGGSISSSDFAVFDPTSDWSSAKVLRDAILEALGMPLT